MWLRRLESRAGTLIGLTGALFAVRRELCQPWDSRIDSDFHAALACIRRGKAAISDPQVLCFYPNVEEPRREYRRKVRTVLRGMKGLACAWRMLNPLRYGVAAFQLFSHKVARWLGPWFFLAVMGLSAALFERGWVYRAMLAAQLALLLAAGAGLLLGTARRLLPVRLATFFVLCNAAIVYATLAFLSGRKAATWEPSVRHRLAPAPFGDGSRA
jgi:hypothetical protein